MYIDEVYSTDSEACKDLYPMSIFESLFDSFHLISVLSLIINKRLIIRKELKSILTFHSVFLRIRLMYGPVMISSESLQSRNDVYTEYIYNTTVFRRHVCTDAPCIDVHGGGVFILIWCCFVLMKLNGKFVFLKTAENLS